MYVWVVHMHMGWPHKHIAIATCIWTSSYAYGTKYVYGIEQVYEVEYGRGLAQYSK